MAAHVDVSNRLLNRRHVTRDALAALAVGSVLRVKYDRATGPWLKNAAMTLDAHGIAGRSQISFVLCAMGIVTRVATYSFAIHLPLNVIISLHPVLVRSAV